MAIRFSYSDEFCKEFKAFAKKWRSIGDLEGPGDFAALKLLLAENPIANVAVERINNLGEEITCPVYKVRKFYCQDLKNSGKIRLIYIYKEVIHRDPQEILQDIIKTNEKIRAGTEKLESLLKK